MKQQPLVKEPAVVKGTFADADFAKLQSTFRGFDRSAMGFDPRHSRYIVHQHNFAYLEHFANKLLPLARATFESQTLVPSYALFAHYEGTPSLARHRDDNACTYTLDLCLYQNEPWDLWVDGRLFTLHENDALAYYGNAQEHWREDFPNPATNHVAMVFFHFIEPRHWYLTRGPRYLEYAILPLLEALPKVSVPEHRFFLESLLSAHDSSDVYGAVERRFPDHDPVDKVFGWVAELATLEGPDLLIARHLANGSAPGRIATEVNERAATAMTTAEVERICAALRASCIAMLFPR